MTRALHRSFVVVFALVMASSVARGDERKLARWQYRDGVTRTYKQVSRIRQEIPTGEKGKTRVQDMQVEYFATVTIDRVDFLGNAEMTLVIHGMRMRVDQNGREIIIDTLDPSRTKLPLPGAQPAPAPEAEEQAAPERADEDMERALDDLLGPEPAPETQPRTTPEKNAPPALGNRGEPKAGAPPLDPKALAGLLSEAVNGITLTSYVGFKGNVLYTRVPLKAYIGTFQKQRGKKPQAALQSLALGLLRNALLSNSQGVGGSGNLSAYIVSLPLLRTLRKGSTWTSQTGNPLAGASARSRWTLVDIAGAKTDPRYGFKFTQNFTATGLFGAMYDVRRFEIKGAQTCDATGLVDRHESDMVMDLNVNTDRVKDTAMIVATVQKLAQVMRDGSLNMEQLPDIMEDVSRSLDEQFKPLGDMRIRQTVHTTIEPGDPPARKIAPPSKAPGEKSAPAEKR